MYILYIHTHYKKLVFSGPGARTYFKFFSFYSVLRQRSHNLIKRFNYIEKVIKLNKHKTYTSSVYTKVVPKKGWKLPPDIGLMVLLHSAVETLS